MNGSGTTYQAFLDLANAAEKKDGMLGDRTVRLVKAGDGLATTTSLGTKGARADQIAGARDAFLLAIAREYGYAARDIAAKALGDGKTPVPLTARTIRAVNQALGDKGALAEESALIRKFKGDFDIEVASSRQLLALRMGTSDIELDRGKIQAEVLKLIKAEHPGRHVAGDPGHRRAAGRRRGADGVAVPREGRAPTPGTRSRGKGLRHGYSGQVRARFQDRRAAAQQERRYCFYKLFRLFPKELAGELHSRCWRE